MDSRIYTGKRVNYNFQYKFFKFIQSSKFERDLAAATTH